ncbi:hypothetical protein [Streptomyces sp. IMTB 2501]|uniref:hypothetical protein n=1 Tax=Streptomyces sp. IMTB 2501 TaxID=1776340 RepID=UPI0021161566|nr:hypothetical protein [Streptomyces sp. IMTB 2501]
MQETKYRARFSADIDELIALIRAERPDVVVANQIEEAPAGRTALLEARSDALLAGSPAICHSPSTAAASSCWTPP